MDELVVLHFSYYLADSATQTLALHIDVRLVLKPADKPAAAVFL